MKKLLLIAGLLLSLQSFGQNKKSKATKTDNDLPPVMQASLDVVTVDSNNIDFLPKFINLTVFVTEKVFGGKHLEKDKITLLNVGGDYPNQALTILIRDANLPKFKGRPEEIYKGKKISVQGSLTEYNGKPQLIVTSPQEITIIN